MTMTDPYTTDASSYGAPDPFRTETADKIVITVKGGKDFSDPWLVIHAASLGEANHLLRRVDSTVAPALDGADMLLAIAQAATNFQARVALSKGGIQATPIQPPPAQPEPQPVYQPAPTAAPQLQQAPVQQWSAGPPAQANGYAQPETVVQLPQQQPQPQQPPAQPAPQQQYAPQQGEFNPPQPGPAPIGASGFPYVWKFGVKDGRQWKAWMSGQPKSNIDAGQPKDEVKWVR